MQSPMNDDSENTKTRYQLSITRKPTYLHAVVHGLNTRENVAAYLEEILTECKARDCYRVLIEQRLDGPRLGVMDVFELVAHGSSRARGVIQAVAYVDIYANSKMLRFAENVAINRAVPGAVFSTVAKAEQWIQSR